MDTGSKALLKKEAHILVIKLIWWKMIAQLQTRETCPSTDDNNLGMTVIFLGEVIPKVKENQ